MSGLGLKKGEPLRIIRSIGDLIFRDLKSFVRLYGFVVRRHGSEDLENYLRVRRTVLGLVFGMLDHFGNKALEARKLPYLYMRTDWPEELPIAGYAGECQCLGWESLLRVAASNWILDLNGSVEFRLKPAALWMTYQRGLMPCVDYLLDLQENDLIVRSESIAATLVWLLGVLAGEGSDSQRVERALGGMLPVSASAWMDVPVENMLQGARAANPAEVQEVFLRMVSRCLSTIQAVRASDSFDSWILGQARVGRLARTIKLAGESLVPNPSVALQAILSQFEELYADAWAMLVDCNRSQPLESSFNLSYAMIKLFRMKLGDVGVERLLDERLLVPVPIHSVLLADEKGSSQLPERWRRLSWRMAQPCDGVQKISRSLFLRRARLPQPEILLQDKLLREVLSSQEINKPDLQVVVIREELLGNHFYAANYDVEVVADAVGAAVDRWSYQQLREHYVGSEPDTTRGELLEISSQIRVLSQEYPWNWLLHQELGITRDRLGEVAPSIKNFMAAILLQPNEPMPWRSLSVVLAKLGLGHDSVVARAIGETLEESEDQEDEKEGGAPA